MKKPRNDKVKRLRSLKDTEMTQVQGGCPGGYDDSGGNSAQKGNGH